MLIIARPSMRLAALAGALLLLGASVPLLGADRYQAWLDDGTQLSARTLPTWPIPGLPYRFDSRDLVQSSNPVRLMVDRQAAVTLAPPYVVLANGDILTGTPTHLAPDEGRIGLVSRVSVQLESPLMPVGGTAALVRTDRVLRIVATSEAEASSPPPGTVVLADGRRLSARSIRWKETGLLVLTEAGIVEASFGDLVDVVFPGVDRTAAVLVDNLWAGGTSDAAIARIQMRGGAVITASRVSREVERIRRRGRSTSDAYYYCQPAWADGPLALPEPLVAWIGYRAANEAPLPMLPSETLANRRLISRPAPWLANRAAGGGLLASDERSDSGGGLRVSDVGLVTHSHSEIAFDLPVAARTLEISVGIDRAAGGGGCVRCKVLAEKSGGEVLWESGVFQSSDGVQETGLLDVAGLVRVVLVTEFAHDDRPAGADPLDIRDQVCWLDPLVRLDLEGSGQAERVLAVLAGVGDWHLAGDGWRDLAIASRWNATIACWEPVLSLPRDAELRLTRQFRVSRTADIVELLTACPLNLEEHDFELKANGKPLLWRNNADRSQLKAWVARYGRSRSRDNDDNSALTDRLAYWWDLSPFQGEQVDLELTIRGNRERSEIAWRGLSIRSAIGNLPESELPLAPDIALTSLAPLKLASHSDRQRGVPLKDAIPTGKNGEPIRFLGQQFTGGYGMSRNSAISVEIPAGSKRFVALAGCCFQVAGPLQVLIDDRVVWERTVLTSLTPAEQLAIDIPPGAKTLTLQSGPEGSYYGFAAWANAGFKK
jgi:hypothetical protein